VMKILRNNTMASKRLIPSIKSLADLRRLTTIDKRYAKLACLAASALGGPVQVRDDAEAALRWLNLNANETSEKGVVNEINFIRDLV
jgi:hypothetical protein